MRQSIIHTTLICFSLLLRFDVFAGGTDSLNSHKVPEIVIVEEGREEAQLMGLHRVHAQPIGESASILLKECTGCFVKNYGPGSLSSISIRGFSASQTQIYWDDIPIFNPMLGQSDLFLLNPLAGQELKVLRDSRAEGSAGELAIHSRNINYSGVELGLYQQMGAWLQNRSGAWLKLGISEKVSMISAVQRESARNDFSYENPHWPGTDKSINRHGAYELWSLRQGFGIELNSNWNLELDYWASFGDRELAPNMTEWSSQRYQFDKQHRLKATINGTWRKNQFKFYSGLVNHSNLYRDSASMIYSDNLSKSVSTGVNLDGQKHGVLYSAMLRHDYQTGSSSTYTEDRHSLHSSVELGYRAEGNGFEIDFLTKIKQSLNGDSWGPVAPEFRVNFLRKGSQSINVSAAVKRQFRFPTLNEQFWKPGGNPNLLSESGWGQFLDVDYRLRKSSSISKLSISAYHQKVDNYILWAPNSTGIWEAGNLDKIKAYGIEARLSQLLQFKDASASITGSYGFHMIGSKSPSGKWEQNIYAPRHQGLFALDFSWRSIDFGSDVQLTGMRFTSTDNAESLPAYFLWNAYVAYQWEINSKHRLEAGLYLDNLMAEDYQTVANRPMPGRSIRFSLKYIFSKER